MVSFIKAVKRYLSHLKIRFYCLLIAFSICASIVISYWQYRLALQNILTTIETHTALSKQELNDSFNSCNAIFNIISSKINEGGERLNEKRISDLLNQFYATSKNPNTTKISFLDITWQRTKGNAINRYGPLTIPSLPTAVETYVRIHPKQAFLYSASPENKTSSTNDYFLSWGVFNNKNVYIGKLTILLDLKTWMYGLGDKIQDHGLIAILVDYHNNMSLPSNLAQPVELKDFTIADSLLLKSHNHKLLFGYNKFFLYKQAFQRTMPLLLVLWSAVLVFVRILFIYSRALKAEIFAGFEGNMKELTHANLKQIKQINKYKHQAASYNNKLNASKISSQEKEKLELQISRRFVSTLDELKEVARVLVQDIGGGLNLKINYDKQLKLLATIHNKLTPIITCHVCNEKNDRINLKEILNDTIKIFSEEIFNQKLSIKPNIKNKNDTLYHDELLLRQVLANLLRASISCSKPSGKIQIYTHNEFVGENEHLVIKITDDGFGLSEDYFKDEESKGQQAILPLMLDSQSIKDLIESNGGQLEIEYTVGHGKTIICSLPYNGKTLVEYGNVIVLHKKY